MISLNLRDYRQKFNSNISPNFAPRFSIDTMDIFEHIQAAVAAAVKRSFDADIEASRILVQPTRKEFEGDYTAVIFPLVKQLRQAPEALGNAIGEDLVANDPDIAGFSVVKGFLNLSLSDTYWGNVLKRISTTSDWWKCPPQGGKAMVEFSSPNTNKPLHLGHIRNILLGWSMSRILEAVGVDVVKVQIVNDRGIAICKSMLAWQKFANGETPESAGVKSDHFVGQWYVRFDKELGIEYEKWQETDTAKDLAESAEDKEAFFKKYKNTYFNEHSQLGREAREMLLKWEANDPEVRALWQQMNNWVYAGFDSTYESMKVEFDKLYYESDTYLLGLKLVDEGLEKGVFYRKDDGSVWIDLEDVGMDQKIVLRSDGTSVYLTQDLGTAQLRYEDFGTERMIYVVGDEQNYHFKVLFECMKRLGAPYADGLFHLSYGMVDLPDGKMKSREGTVVDADDLMEEVYQEARKAASERGEIAQLEEEEQEEILRRISLSALKYFIIKVEPKRRMTFNPAESVDMQGQTGPYIQNAYVRIQSILRKAQQSASDGTGSAYVLNTEERNLLATLLGYTQVVEQAAEQYNPGAIANYCYQLAKALHRYYHEFRILNAETDAARSARLQLIEQIGVALREGMYLLGIEMPSRM